MTFTDTSSRAFLVAAALASLGHDHGGYWEAWHGLRCRCGSLLTGQVEAEIGRMRQERQAAA